LSRLCAIPAQICASLRVIRENAKSNGLQDSRRIAQFDCPKLSEKLARNSTSPCDQIAPGATIIPGLTDCVSREKQRMSSEKCWESSRTIYAKLVLVGVLK
jgi:hypothetical protein